MSAGRSQPLVHGGRGNLTPQGVARLNAAMRRATVFGGNATCPITSGPTGTVMQRRARPMFRERGFPYGSTRFMWGVDVAADRKTVYVGEGLLTIANDNTGSICSGATVGPFTAEASYIIWRCTAHLAPTIVATPQTELNAYFKPFGDAYDDFTAPQGVLYRVSCEQSGTDYLVTGVVPYQFGPIIQQLPQGTDGKTLKWDNFPYWAT